MGALGDQIRLMRKLRRFKKSNLYHLLVSLQACAPLSSLFVKVNAKEPRLAIPVRLSLILLIHRIGRFTEIGDTVVALIAIDMVNGMNRPLAMHV